jgi:hypothetical protein
MGIGACIALGQSTYAGGGARTPLPAQDISTEGMLGSAAEPRTSTTVSFDRDTRTVGIRFSVVVDAFASALGVSSLRRDRGVSRVPAAQDLGKRTGNPAWREKERTRTAQRVALLTALIRDAQPSIFITAGSTCPTVRVPGIRSSLAASR